MENSIILNCLFEIVFHNFFVKISVAVVTSVVAAKYFNV